MANLSSSYIKENDQHAWFNTAISKIKLPAATHGWLARPKFPQGPHGLGFFGPSTYAHRSGGMERDVERAVVK